MSEMISTLPVAFWVAIALLAGGSFWAAGKIREGIGLPILAVIGTVTAWYVVDLFYNDTDYESYAETFPSDVLTNAWWQVVLFLIVFYGFATILNEKYNSRYLQKTSSVYRMLKKGVTNTSFQQRLNALSKGCLVIWILLAVIATTKLGNETPYYFFPFLGHKADPWGRARLGAGADALLSVAGYLQLFVSASFGVVTALATTPRVRRIGFIACCFLWPFFIFDRTRNVIIAATLPGVLAWTALRLRGSWLKRGAILGLFFLLLNTWFGFIIANRNDTTIAAAFEEKGLDFKRDASHHHQGLNMYGELCWINTLMDSGLYQPNWGERYVAELVNPIPRTLWPDKPLVGIDYAIARGQSFSGGDAGVGASISTGMIGQGVVNFGPFLGPIFSAFLMSIWAASLSRLDLQGQEVMLYILGLILTFNLGRDITFLTLYTYIFGAVMVWFASRVHRWRNRPRRRRIHSISATENLARFGPPI